MRPLSYLTCTARAFGVGEARVALEKLPAPYPRPPSWCDGQYTKYAKAQHTMYARQSLLQRSRVSDSSTPSHGRREPLTKEGIVVVALTIVDREGLSALNMRHLGAALGFKAMAVYKHYPNKAAILDGVVAAVFDDLDEATIRGRTGAPAYVARSSRSAGFSRPTRTRSLWSPPVPSPLPN